MMDSDKQKLKDLIDKIFSSKFTGHIGLNFFESKLGNIEVKKTHKSKDIVKIKLG